MSEVFMVIKRGSKLYEDYFDWWNGRGEMLAAANSVFEQFGIESNQFYLKRDRLTIEPTESDKKKFSDVLMADGQSFKKCSAPNRAWVEAMKNIKHLRKPQIFRYMPAALLGCRWKEQLFHMGEILYCRIDSSGENTTIPEFATAIKGSEYYAAMETKTEGQDERREL